MVSKSKIKINTGQIDTIRGGIKRDAENFLREIEKHFIVEYSLTNKARVKSRFVNYMLNFLCTVGLVLPVDLFKAKNFAEIQFSGHGLIRKKSRHIIRLHDLFPITNPKWFRIRTRRMFKYSLKSAIKSGNTTFVCNSNFTFNVLKEMFPKEKYVAYVVPCTFELKDESLCRNCKGCSELNHLYGDYIIMVGTVEPRKSYETIISAIEQINSKIVILGRYGWRQRSVRKKLIELEKQGKLLWINSCCDGALLKYYKSASLFLSTSIEEGFNIPATEAMILGLKMVLSRNFVHEERYSSVASLFNSKDEMISMIKSLIS